MKTLFISCFLLASFGALAQQSSALETPTSAQRQDAINQDYSAGSRYTTRFSGVDLNYAWRRIDVFMYEQWNVNCTGPQLLKQQGENAVFVARETNISGKPITFYFDCTGDAKTNLYTIKKLRVEGEASTVARFFVRFWEVPFQDVAGPLHYNYKGERIDFKYLSKATAQIATGSEK